MRRSTLAWRRSRLGRLYGMWVARRRWQGRTLSLAEYGGLARCIDAEFDDEGGE